MPPTTLLMLCLLVATSLGAGIGACLWHLRSAGRFRRALHEERGRAEAEREALEKTLHDERERAAARREELEGKVRAARERAERVRTRHDALTTHARDQGRRIDVLEAEVLAYETRQPVPRHGTGEAPRDRELSSGGDKPGVSVVSRSEDDLPVLNRRVRSGGAVSRVTSSSPGAGTLGASASRTAAVSGSEANLRTGGEPGTPALPEAESPGAVDDRALGLPDTRERLPDADER